MSEYATMLERGLAGGVKARTKYEQTRPLRYMEMTGWVKRGYDEKVAQAKEKLTSALQERVWSFGQNKDTERALAMSNWIGDWLTRTMNHESIEGAANALDKIEKQEELVKADSDFFQQTPVLEAHIRRAARELTLYAVKATALNDFFESHPAQLGEKDRIRIADELESHWKLKDHDTIRKILEAEKRLSGLFEAHQPSQQERALAVKWIALDSKPKTLEEVEALFWRKKPKNEAGGENDHGGESSKVEWRSILEKRYPELDKTKLKEMVNMIVHLERRQLQTPAKTKKMLGKYKGNDPHGFLKAFHDQAVNNKHEGELQEKEGGAKGKPPEENWKDDIVPPGGGSETHAETPDQLLDRLARMTENEEARGSMIYPDHVRLSKMLSQKEISARRLKEAIKHDVLFRVANHLKGSGTHIINIKGLAGRFPVHYRVPVYEAIDELLKEGSLHGIKEKPSQNEPLLIAHNLMPKYHDQKKY